jgi:hypothetical protein
MGLYALEELTRKWQHEQLTAEQMIGQLLQHVGVRYERVRLLERRAGGSAECRMQSAECRKEKGTQPHRRTTQTVKGNHNAKGRAAGDLCYTMSG